MAALISVSIALSQTSRSCKSTDTGYSVASACLAPSLRRYQFLLLAEQRHICVNNFPSVLYVKRIGRDSNLRPTLRHHAIFNRPN